MNRLSNSSIKLKAVATALVAAALLSSTSYAGAKMRYYEESITITPKKECRRFLIWSYCPYSFSSSYGFPSTHANSSASEIRGGESNRTGDSHGLNGRSSQGKSAGPGQSGNTSSQASHGLSGPSSPAGGPSQAGSQAGSEAGSQAGGQSPAGSQAGGQSQAGSEAESKKGPKGNNGFGNGDQDAPGNSLTHNNAENSSHTNSNAGQKGNSNGNRGSNR